MRTVPTERETFKDLELLWGEPGLGFDARSTILVDDSPAKAVLQPANLLLLPAYDVGNTDLSFDRDDTLRALADYLRALRSHMERCARAQSSAAVHPS
jgi:hypothetical protein